MRPEVWLGIVLLTGAALGVSPSLGNRTQNRTPSSCAG